MNRIITLLIIVLCLTGCRKSANHRRSNSGTVVEQRHDNNRSAERTSPVANKKSNRKLEGQEIFDKYATAVFMVFKHTKLLKLSHKAKMKIS